MDPHAGMPAAVVLKAYMQVTGAEILSRKPKIIANSMAYRKALRIDFRGAFLYPSCVRFMGVPAMAWVTERALALRTDSSTGSVDRTARNTARRSAVRWRRKIAERAIHSDNPPFIGEFTLLVDQRGGFAG
jgi:hypothetical protein